MTAWAPPRLTLPGAVREYALAVALVGSTAWAGVQAIRFYEAEILPYREAVVVPSSRPRGVRADDPAEVRRWQRVMDATGEAVTFTVSGHYDWARQRVDEILRLDPGNKDALALRERIEREAPPAPAPTAPAAQP